MRRAVLALLTILIILCGALLVSGILTLFFIVLGKFFAMWFNLTLFEATILCVTVTLVTAAIIFIFTYSNFQSSLKFKSWMSDDECNCPACVLKRKSSRSNKLHPRKV